MCMSRIIPGKCCLVLVLFSLTPHLLLASPQDPHVPGCWNSKFSASNTSKPCSWFEGWYTRIIDPATGNSFAAIVGTMDHSGESMVTLLACYSKKINVTDNGIDDAPGKSNQDTSFLTAEEAWKSVAGGFCGNLHSSQIMAKGATVTAKGLPVVKNPERKASPDFEWSLPGHGFIKVNSQSTLIDLIIDDVSLKANLTNQKGWKEGDPSASPEGWPSTLVPFLLPCRWYIYSLGSEAEYRFRNGSTLIAGKGWGHEEKNWGKMFPKGHVWAQAISADNKVQIALAVAYFQVLGVTSPHIVSIGYRSGHLKKDFNSVNIMNFVTELTVKPCEGKVNILVHSLSHSLRVEIYAPPETFSPKFVAPTKDGKWEPLCQESFSAIVRIGLWERTDTWLKVFRERLKFGPLGENRKVERFDIHGAALEFGEELLCENHEKLENVKKGKVDFTTAETETDVKELDKISAKLEL